MQILLASAKIMNDKVSVLPDFTLSTPAFRKEAESFARDMAQYSTETIAEILGCSHQIAAQNHLRFMRFFEDMETLPAILAYHGQAYKHLKAETLYTSQRKNTSICSTGSASAGKYILFSPCSMSARGMT